jgi:DNA-binding NarL/FixJ family response regulator
MAQSSPSPSVLLIDDHALFRTGLRLMLSAHWPQAVLNEATTVEAALAPTTAQPDLVLLDMNLPGVHGLSGLPLLRERFGSIPMVIVSAQDDDHLVQEATELGANGFLSKTAPPDLLSQALKDIAQGLPVWLRSGQAPRQARRLEPVQQPDGPWQPSAQQRRILSLLGTHRSNKALAKALQLSENQARAEVSVLMERLEVISRDAAHQVARQRGWVDEPEPLLSAQGSLSAP